MDIVRRIKLLCSKEGISLNAFEQKSGVGRGNVARWKENIPKIDKVQKVADYFGVSTDYLLGITDDPTPQGKTPSMVHYNPVTKEFEEYDKLPPEAQERMKEYYQMLKEKYLSTKQE